MSIISSPTGRSRFSLRGIAALAALTVSSLFNKQRPTIPLPAPTATRKPRHKAVNRARESARFQYYLIHGYKGKRPPKPYRGYLWKRDLRGPTWRLYKAPAGDPYARLEQHPYDAALVLVHSAHGYLRPVVKHRGELQHEAHLLWLP